MYCRWKLCFGTVKVLGQLKINIEQLQKFTPFVFSSPSLRTQKQIASRGRRKQAQFYIPYTKYFPSRRNKSFSSTNPPFHGLIATSIYHLKPVYLQAISAYLKLFPRNRHPCILLKDISVMQMHNTDYEFFSSSHIYFKFFIFFHYLNIS